MFSLPQRVACRYLYGDTIADPKEAAKTFETLALTKFCYYEEQAKVDIEKAQKLIGGINTGVDPKINYQLVQDLKETDSARFGLLKLDTPRAYKEIKKTAEPLFWAILQQYQLTPQLRRGIESALRFWAKTQLTKPRIKSLHGSCDRIVEELQAYLKVCEELHKQIANAQAAIVKGKLHTDPEVAAETKIKAGSFTLINTGGFDATVMAKTADLVEKAEKAMRSIGQGNVCYGDILVSKTIQKKNVAAFYVIDSDEMFVRANLPPRQDVIQTICHELTHRLYYKFLQSKKSAIRDAYITLKIRQRVNLDTIPEEYLPQRGEEVVSEGKKFKLTEVSKYEQKVKFTKDGDPPNVVYRAPVMTWLKMKGIEPHQIPDYKGFITKYAEKDPEENFCEMVSHYAIGKLPESQIELLLAIL